ncbi:MAG TPA: BadF/BadG/BcrA/BcrD ATPase family protein [Isosphaeraceae bacterium]|jgi:N-acetylglucosamine kinase-like BadF-type ATPase
MTGGEPLLLGVDGGGTSTVACLAIPGGRILGRGRAGPSNAKAVGPEAAKATLGRAIATAFAAAGRAPGPVAVACLGLAGFDRPEDRQLLEEWSAQGRWADRLVLVNDGDLVVAAGTPRGWGVAVIGGTGSIAVGRAPDGRTARAGGWGYLFGDEGSAYAVAVAALRRVARRADGREPTGADSDPLTRHLCRALGIAGPGGLVSALYAPGVDRARVAALAPTVLTAAAEDEAIAREILRPAGSDLAAMVRAAARTLGWAGGGLPLAMAGGFLLAAPVVARSLLDHLKTAGYDPLCTPVPEPALGAVVLAERALDAT